MATKKPSRTSSKAQQQVSPRKLENLAARPSYDDLLDEQLVDHSGVFRVTSAIQQNQVGHNDDNNPRFASDSLVMAAQRGGDRDDVTLDEPVDSELVIEDEAAAAAKRQRLATLAALAQRKQRRR